MKYIINLTPIHLNKAALTRLLEDGRWKMEDMRHYTGGIIGFLGK